MTDMPSENAGLVVRGLTTTFDTPRGLAIAAADIDFDVAPGEVVGLVGESGSGKSVTLRSIMRLIREPGHVSGRVEWRGRDLVAMSAEELRRIRGSEIAMIFQEPMTALNPVLQIGMQIEENLVAHTTLNARERQARALELMNIVGIPAAERRLREYPHQFSGGMRQRAMIAIALACSPKLLLADEPTTALDVTIQDQILKLLLDLRERLSMSVVFVTHDLGVVAATCDRMAVMYAGRIVETGTVAEVFARPRHPYTRGLLGSVPRSGTSRTMLQSIEGTPPSLTDLPAGCSFNPRCNFATGICRTERPPLEPVDSGGRKVACFHHERVGCSGGDPVNANLPLLSIDGVSKRFAGPYSLTRRLQGKPPLAVQALSNVTLEVHRGETLGIVGESGCGKSTLARCLVRLHEPDGGAVRFEGKDIALLRGGERRAFNRRVQMIFQDPYGSLNPRMTVSQIIGEALSVHKMRPKAEIPQRIVELLELVRLPQDAAARYPHEFSGGQRQRIGIARALAVEPNVIVADELVSALDVSVQAQVVNLLLQLQDQLHLTVIFVAHDLRLVRHISHRVAVMYLGQVMEVSPAEALFTAPRHPYSKALLDAAPELDPARRSRTVAARGELPSPLDIPPGCPFASRCPHAFDRCRVERPFLTPRGRGQMAACHLTDFGAVPQEDQQP